MYFYCLFYTELGYEYSFQLDLKVDLKVDVSNKIPDSPPYAKYQIPNPHTDRLKFYNETTKELYEKSFSDFRSPRDFHNFCISERKWRFEIQKEAENKEKVVFEETKSDHGGLAKNVKRYSQAQLPRFSSANDLAKCSNTIASMNTLIHKINEFCDKKVNIKKSSLYSKDMTLLPGRKSTLRFIEGIINRMAELSKEVELLREKMITTELELRRRFGKEEATKKDKSRVSRRRKEREKKKKQRRCKILKRHVSNTIEVICSNPQEVKPDACKENPTVRVKMDNLIADPDLKPRFHLEALIQLRSKGVFASDAISLHW